MCHSGGSRLNDNLENGVCKDNLDDFHAVGYAVSPVRTDPRNVVGGSSRERVKFLGLHVNDYCEQRGFVGDDNEKFNYVKDYVNGWKALVQAILECEHPIIDLSCFLLPDSDGQIQAITKAMEAKVFSESMEKRSRKGTDWTRIHKVAYTNKGLPWSDPASRDSAYDRNAHFLALPLRERDIILYWDAVSCLNESNGVHEEDISPYLSLQILIYLFL